MTVRGEALRHLAHPDVPTVSAAGLPGFGFNSGFAVMAPAGTSAAVVAKLNAEIVRALEEPARLKP